MKNKGGLTCPYSFGDVVRPRGFTLVELVVVVIVLGILSVTLLPRFANKSDYDQVGFRDQVRSVLQHARKTAIASRRYVCVTAGAGGVSLQLDPRLPDGLAVPSCSVNLNIPGSGANSISPPSGVSLSSSAPGFRFDPLGRASSAVTLTVAGQPVSVDQETGYAR